MHFPRWLGPIEWVVVFPLAHIMLSLWISAHFVRHGWLDGSPSGWNLVGIVPITAGVALIAGALRLHFVSGAEGWELELTPRYLLTRGPFRFTRNPMYVAAIAIWFGWAVFYGSEAMLAGLAVIWAAATFAIVPFEERRLEKRFGETYREYRRRVPRWIGRSTN